MTRSVFSRAFCFVLLMSSVLVTLGDELREQARTLFGTLTVTNAGQGSPTAELGRALFWDTRISANGETACASCHLPEYGGADARRFSPDARGKLTSRNSQTVFNAMLQPRLRWTGDRKSGAHQAEKSLTGSMGFSNATEVVPVLKQLGYEPEFKRAFGAEGVSPISPANYAQALEVYQATLITRSPFDRYLSGDDGALTAQQRAGLKTFINIGCADCHNGPLLGGRSIRKFGTKKDYWTETKSAKIDQGLFETTKAESDRYKFRVPMLRNIEATAPFFHDGSVAELSRAIQVMGTVQLGEDLTSDDVARIVAFLQSLTGEVPPHYSPAK